MLLPIIYENQTILRARRISSKSLTLDSLTRTQYYRSIIYLSTCLYISYDKIEIFYLFLATFSIYIHTSSKYIYSKRKLLRISISLLFRYSVASFQLIFHTCNFPYIYTVTYTHMINITSIIYLFWYEWVIVCQTDQRLPTRRYLLLVRAHTAN